MIWERYENLRIQSICQFCCDLLAQATDINRSQSLPWFKNYITGFDQDTGLPYITLLAQAKKDLFADDAMGLINYSMNNLGPKVPLAIFVNFTEEERRLAKRVLGITFNLDASFNPFFAPAVPVQADILNALISAQSGITLALRKKEVVATRAEVFATQP